MGKEGLQPDQIHKENAIGQRIVPITKSAWYDRFTRVILHNGRDIQLSVGEAKFLEVLRYHPDQSFLREDLYKILYPRDFTFDVYEDQIICAQAKRLRTKLHPVTLDRELIETERGFSSYRWSNVSGSDTPAYPQPKKIADGLDYDYFHRAIKKNENLFSAKSKCSQLLELLIFKPDQVVSYQDITKHMYGLIYDDNSDSRTHIEIVKSRLCSVLEIIQPGLSYNILRENNAGYRWYQKF
jgi:DNA-binding response OmpR family regulator